MKRALGITRVSSSEQASEDRYSIPHQKNHISEECRHKGYDLVHILEYVQSGGKVLKDTSKERTEILQFIKDFDIEVVIVHELDRLARSMLDTLLFTDELNKLGVAFVSIHDGFDTTTAQGQLQMHILAAFAEYFRKQLASKVMGGLIERAKKGLHCGRRPYGYVLTEKGFEIEPEEAKVVKKIYQLYLEDNLGTRSIAEALNKYGYRSQRGNPWSYPSIKDILTNENYTGTFVWNNIKVENNHPAIIDRKTWEAVQARKKQKNHMGGRAQNQNYLLSGLLRCAKCGYTLIGRTSNKSNYKPGIYRYYVCCNYAMRGSSSCDMGYIHAETLEGLVRKEIEEIVEQKGAILNLIPAENDILLEELEIKKKEIKKIDQMRHRAAEAYEMGQYDLDFFTQRKNTLDAQETALRDEIRALEAKINGHLSAEEAIKRTNMWVNMASQFLSEMDFAKSKSKLQRIVDKIVVRAKDDADIYFRA